MSSSTPAHASDVSRPGRLGVMERATLIMDAFVDAPGELVLEDITQITGLPRSTVFRMLRQLGELGWVRREGRTYSLGPRITRHAHNDEDAIRIAASPLLSDLQRATGAVVHLSVLRGSSVFYLDKVGGDSVTSVPSRVGARIPATEVVSGVAMLAWLEPEQVDELIAPADEQAAARVHRELAEVRRRDGLAWFSPERSRSGFTSIAAAVLGPDGPVAAISVVRRGHLSMRAIAPQLIAATRETSHTLYPGRRRTGHLRSA